MNRVGVTPSRPEQFEAALRRHGADLSRLRGGRGLVPCILPGHDDRSASLSLDCHAAVFNCFGCGRSGGVKALLALLGESHAAPGPRVRPESDLQHARRAVMQREGAAAARRAEWAPYDHVNAHIGRCSRATYEARALATQLGSADPRTWPLLERAAEVEREGFTVEAELDAILEGGRIA
jgi:hypothetical protein